MTCEHRRWRVQHIDHTRVYHVFCPDCEGRARLTPAWFEQDHPYTRTENGTWFDPRDVFTPENGYVPHPVEATSSSDSDDSDSGDEAVPESRPVRGRSDGVLSFPDSGETDSSDEGSDSQDVPRRRRP